jgi:hypothetical protein
LTDILFLLAGMNDKDNCRITCHLVGLEWFMYNRTPAYDVLASTLGLNPDASPFETSAENPNPSVSGTFPEEVMLFLRVSSHLKTTFFSYITN